MSTLRLAWLKEITNPEGRRRKLEPAALADGTFLEMDMEQFNERMVKLVREELGAKLSVTKHRFTLDEIREAIEHAQEYLETEMRELTVKLP